MARYIDAEALYEKAAELEAQALAQIEKLNSRIPLEEMAIEEYIEWRVWSAILTERSAFKYDVFDAPTADVVEVVRCKDCKWFDRTQPYGTLSPNAFHCNANERFFRDDFYCGYGERRE